MLDVLLDRKPFVEHAAAVWSAVEGGRAEGPLSAHAVTTLHYLNARAVGPRTARETTTALLSVFGVAAVDGRCHAIVTRNPRDFKGSPVRVLAPAEAAAWLSAAGVRGRAR